MGCGASSLKGDDVPEVNSNPTPVTPPMRKVNTNFSTVNYDQDSQERRLTEYAPHETPRSKSNDLSAGRPPHLGHAEGQNDSLAADPSDRHAGSKAGASSSGAGGEETLPPLKPYTTFDGGDWDNDTAVQAPNVDGTDQQASDPTSTLAKDEFATDNDPANPLNQESHEGNNHHNHHQNQNHQGSSTDDPSDSKKSSWLGQKYASFQSAKRGSGISDEDLKKYTGKDRAELSAWAKNAPGVGGNQGGGRPGTDSALAGSAPWTAS